MAGNFGKFIDRSPIICAAGKPTGDPYGDTVSTILKQYTVEDAITAIKHNANIWKEDIFEPPLKLPPIKNADFNLTDTEIVPILNPHVETRYETLLTDLKETTYESYWKKEIGKGKDQTPGLPAGTCITEVTYGNPSIKETPLKELVSPPKTPYQVLWDSQIGHDMYKKTHNDYNPSEQINRGYKSPPFISTKSFGMKTKYDPRGIWVRCCCDWHIKEPMVHANKIQADYSERTKHQLGKVLAPNHNIECVPKDHAFGDLSTRSFYGVKDLLKNGNVPPCIFKRDFYKWMRSLNKLRLKMKERATKDFNFDDFYTRALYLDKEKIGYLPIEIFYDLCACPDIHISFPKHNIEALLKLLNIIKDNQINYKRFIDLINFNAPPLELTPIEDIPKQYLYYVTTSRAATCDYLIIDNSVSNPAGIPSIRTDLLRPVVHAGQCRADLENLGDYTSANALICPSIYSNYGLNFRDFFMPRSAETLKKLFENIGYRFSEACFEKIWKEGQELDKTGLVCIDTFKTLLKKYYPPPKLSVDELECTNKIG